MSMRGRPEKWGVSSMEIGDSITCTPKQLVYLKQRFRKYGYTMVYETYYGVESIRCTRIA